MIENDRYVLGGAGYLVEDLVHVTGAGPVVMTDVPRDPVLSG